MEFQKREEKGNLQKRKGKRRKSVFDYDICEVNEQEAEKESGFSLGLLAEAAKLLACPEPTEEQASKIKRLPHPADQPCDRIASPEHVDEGGIGTMDDFTKSQMAMDKKHTPIMSVDETVRRMFADFCENVPPELERKSFPEKLDLLLECQVKAMYYADAALKAIDEDENMIKNLKAELEGARTDLALEKLVSEGLQTQIVRSKEEVVTSHSELTLVKLELEKVKTELFAARVEIEHMKVREEEEKKKAVLEFWKSKEKVLLGLMGELQFKGLG